MVKGQLFTAELKRAYEDWLSKMIVTSTGERKRRLLNANNHAEKMFIQQVWWPAIGRFDNLHAEFEVKDFKDGSRYLDFAYIAEGYKICFEVDGYGPHWRDIDRKQFADHLIRQNHLVVDGWIVLRFAYDDIIERPRLGQQLIQQLFGKIGASVQNQAVPLSPTEMSIMRIAASLSTNLTPKHVAEKLHLHRSTAVRHLRALVKKQLLFATRSDVKRVCGYTINKARLPHLLN
ncbi:DNA-binding response regulator [Cohnella endophytica]|uniref:DNA-binding response regulator n=1 Tax=Cohnella endophytica TaxID=2419778 RepID=A0A494XWI8_9BACL|nr:DNA-binding response regulator [Cohnella endophytica]RKP54975.1 DNA-binding response regulator [Cohnella endophytica]